ncbi:MAG TPA: MerR family transcriptional regulator [Rhabdochlamydiaceae bacterium]|nr:MerR family transcriptional regulator [Rhabdochlamydiaceae bacterium]
MAYTVSKLAKLSGVSVRTLHWYDQVGLLRPAYHGVNGYRFYEEEQLLVLQQILFFRELGFELKQIEKILRRSDFDKMTALSLHRQVLEKNVERTKKLIKTIDRTIEHLKGTKKMKDQEIYHGFSKEKQDEYQKYLINRFGDKIEDSIKESNEKVKKMSKEEFEKHGKDWVQILDDLAKQWKKQVPVGSVEVQKIIRRHYEWLKKYWTPDRISYAGMGEGYTGFEWKDAFKAYDPKHPKFAQFLAEGMRVFAEKELS